MITRTFSKAFGLANMRLGYAVATRETARCLAQANAKWPTGALAQAAGVAAIEDKSHLEETLRVVREGRRRLKSAFEQLGFPVVSDPQGNYIMVDVSPSGETAMSFANKVFEKGLVIIRGDFSERYVRTSIGRPEENERLMNAVHELMEEAVR